MKSGKFELSQLATYIGVATFSCGLGLFAYLGTFNRYYADDWCYNADFLELGLFGTLQGYTYITTYASNRFSLTLFSGLFNYLGILGIQLITLLLILLLLLSTYYLVCGLKRIWLKEIPNPTLFLLSGMLVYFTIYLAPHPYQSFYWRTGILPYTAPLALAVLIISLLLNQEGRASIAKLGAIAFLSFFAGGFTESGNALLVTSLLIYICLTYFLQKNTGERASLVPGSVALVFALIAMLLLIVAPTSQIRMARYETPATPAEFGILLSGYTFEFIQSSFVSFPIPHLVLILTLCSLSVLVNSGKVSTINRGQLLICIGAVTILGGLLIAASYAPSAYIEKFPPALRTRVIARFVLTATIFCISWLSGILIVKNRPLVRPLAWVSLAILGLSFAYAIRSIGITFTLKYPVYQERAEIWDDRDKLIRESKREGVSVVDVQGIDGYPIGGLRDLKENPSFWINVCAARYYGVEAIQTTLP